MLAERFVERGWLQNHDDYLLLVCSGVAAVVRGNSHADGLAALVAAPRAERARLGSLQMPLLMRASEQALIRSAGVSGLAPDETAPSGQIVSGGRSKERSWWCAIRATSAE